MMYKQAMKVPVLLLIVGVTFMLCGQVSTSCSCSGIFIKGRGECNTSYRGKKLCYVNPGQCLDQIKGSSSNRFWSYQACEVSKSCSCSGYVTSKGNGECNTSYRGKKFCYVKPGQCSDQIKGSFSNRFWSYQACERSISPLPQVHKTQLLRALAEPVTQRTTPVGRERVTVTQTTRTPVIQVSGHYYNVNKDGFINCQTREDCPPNFETSNYDSFFYGCQEVYNETNETWIGDICEEWSVRGITCGNGKRAKYCSDCGTTEEECGGIDFKSGASPLTWSSAIGGTGRSSATNPDRYDECRPRYCRRGDRCCLLVNIGWSNTYLGCPSYC